jgi:hypothetical protein
MAKKKLTLRQEEARTERIQDALYFASRAVVAHELVGTIPYFRGPIPRTSNGKMTKPTRRPELQVLADSMSDYAADMLLKAFDGHIDGKKLKKPKKAPR